MSITDTKLRSFNISSNKMYERFKQIQLERGKNTSLRLNELIEKEVKEADPQFKELSAIRSKEVPDIIIPNPFFFDQAHALDTWEKYLKTLTKKEHSQIYVIAKAIQLFTYDFNECVDSK